MIFTSRKEKVSHCIIIYILATIPYNTSISAKSWSLRYILLEYQLIVYQLFIYQLLLIIYLFASLFLFITIYISEKVKTVKDMINKKIIAIQYPYYQHSYNCLLYISHFINKRVKSWLLCHNLLIYQMFLIIRLFLQKSGC